MARTQSDRPAVITLSPATAYVSKDNILYPEYDSNQRAEQDDRAQTRLRDVLPTASDIVDLDEPTSA